MPTRAALAVAALLASALPGTAAVQLLPGRTLTLVKVGGSGPERTVFVAKDAGITIPTPDGPDDPRSGGATLAIHAASGESATLPMPAAGWRLNRAGTVYRFRGTSPVKSALLKNGKLLRVVATTTGITLDEPSQGSVGLVFTTGAAGTARYCADFGGTVTRDGAGKFFARRADAPPECPGPPVCGDGAIETGERCDGPGSSCGGTAVCAADCTCPCDFLDPAECLYPFPSDWLTVPDPATDTGRRVHFSADGMPRNASNVPIAHAAYNLNDGFSPGASVLLKVPGVDLAMTGAAPITDIERSLDADAPIVLVNAATLAHHPFWAELDANAAMDADRSLILRPAVNFDEGTRYVVALRNVKDAGGAPITPGADFLAYRDGTPTGDPVKEARRPHMESLFATLAAAGVARGDLYLAWDFTVASTRNITERLLFMRDDAFARLGASAPVFTVTNVENNLDARIFRRVTGTFQVERYVDATTPPAKMILDANGLPTHQPTPQPAPFVCAIPRAALPTATDPATPGRAAIYGHGLLGSHNEVNASNVKSMGNEHNFVFCATKWIGMADEDVPNAIAILQDLGKFPSFTDRLQQAMVNQLFLARLMIHPAGFVSHPAFQDAFGAPVIDTSAVFFDGNSQGGIFGGTVMAIAQDITRGVLGVPGMNYSTLLTRSIDFALYATVLYPAYPNELQRPLLLALIQMLWDRSEPNGYARHITNDPLPNTPSHQVLLHVAFGDHQVANVATEVEARTIGAAIHQPALAPGRHSDVDPYFGIPAIPSYPFAGSAMVIWDSGAATPPITNTAPNVGADPHSDPRSSVAARVQKSEFLKIGGAVIDVCGGAPCVAP
jgi:hypothetical protein